MPRPKASVFGMQHAAWMDRAACASHPRPELWTGSGPRYVPREAAVAADICRTLCPVLGECDRWIRTMFAPHDRWGVWAGVMWTGKQEPSPNIPGMCKVGHMRENSRYCAECDELVHLAAKVMEVGLLEYVAAFGRSGPMAAKVLREFGVEP